MIDADEHLERIRAQFGKQADVYARMRQTTDEQGLNGLVLLSGANAGDRHPSGNGVTRRNGIARKTVTVP